MTDIEKGLEAARRALIDVGYCCAGTNGTGDPEINAIDIMLAKIRTERRLGKLTEMGFTDAAEFVTDLAWPERSIVCDDDGLSD